MSSSMLTSDRTIRAALDGTLTLQDGTRLDRQQADVALAYGIRNRGAHQTGAAPALWERFTEVRDAMFRTLSLTIDTLYP